MSALIHKDRLADKAFTGMIRQMAVDIGAEGLIRQHAAIMSRPDNRPLLPASNARHSSSSDARTH